MFKKTLMIALLAGTAASAETVTGTIEDQYVNVMKSVPVTRQECQMVDVPVYGTVQRQGDAGAGALTGMILGGLIGKGATGDDDGAAAGAVLGGIIGANEGGRTRTERVITGYTQERQCSNVTEYRNVEERMYDFSTITFVVDGVEYQATFVKPQ